MYRSSRPGARNATAPRSARSAPVLICFLALLAMLHGAAAQDATTSNHYFALPGATTSTTDDAITIRYGAYHETYVTGLGWLSGIKADAPVVRAGEVLVNSTCARRARHRHAAAGERPHEWGRGGSRGARPA